MRLTFKQLLATFKGRWQQSAEHERKLMLVLLATLVIVILWVSVWAPQRQALVQAEQAHNEELELQTVIGQLPSAVKSDAPSPLNAETLSGLLTRSSSEAQLNLERMDMDTAGQINLSLNGSLTNLIPWLDQLSQQGVLVHSLSITVNPDQQLSVQLTLQVGAT
ncbi:MAG: type II secretion system protein GspM [Pseudomonas sp.]|uniref:type II secretion system protein GspM n=1 Tax=Pseudomonas sp. TaxID=306 RepID=UPI0030F36BFB